MALLHPRMITGSSLDKHCMVAAWAELAAWAGVQRQAPLLPSSCQAERYHSQRAGQAILEEAWKACMHLRLPHLPCFSRPTDEGLEGWAWG